MSYYWIKKTTNGNYRLIVDGKVEPLCAGVKALATAKRFCLEKYGVTPVDYIPDIGITIANETHLDQMIAWFQSIKEQTHGQITR